MTRTTTQYTYNTQPHSAPRPGAMDQSVPLTMMSDPRVVRGNTYSLARKIAKERTERSQDFNEPGKISSFSARESSSMPSYQFSSRPFALDGMDLTQFLVDQSEQEVIPSRICETQTDELLTLPSPQPYVPLKTGVDNCTQVDDVTELFNFNDESAPLVEVIVKKTLEQALIEINHEEELSALQQRMDEFELQRQQELEWMKQQEDSVVQDYMQVRGVVEKMQQQLKKARDVKKKIAGLQMMRQIIPTMIQNVMTGDRWRSPEEQDARQNILPEIVSITTENIVRFQQSGAIVDELLGGAVEKFHDTIVRNESPQTMLRKISIRLVRIQQEEVTNETEEGPVIENRETRVIAGVLSLPVEPIDSIKSLEEKFRGMLSTLRNPKSSESSTEEESVPASNENDWYPVSVPLYGGISEVIMINFYDARGLPRIPVANDGQLSFFPLNVEAIVIDHVLS